MIQTSQQYKEAITKATRSSAAKIHFGVYDVTAKDEAVINSADSQPFTSPQSVNSGIREPDYKMATFERDYFKLDGSFCLMPDDVNPADDILGWWSKSMSDESRGFVSTPKLTVTFDSLHSSLGIGLFFGTEEYCTDFEITWYNEATQLGYEKVVGNSLQDVNIYYPIENYNKIVIGFLKTRNPYRYARLMELSFGVEESFDNNNLISASTIEEVDPGSGVLSINQLTFTVLNQDQRFNMLNPEGVYAYLQRRQKIVAQSGILLPNGSYEYVPMGVYYLSEWKNSTGLTATLKATDVIGLLDKTMYYASPFWVNEPIENVVRHVLNDAGEFFVSISPVVASERVNGYIPPISHREALAQILVATRCVLRVGRNGILQLYRVSYEAPDKAIDNSVMIGYPTIEQKQLITAVEAKEYTHTLSPSAEEIHRSKITLSGTQVITVTYDKAASGANLVLVGGTIIGTPKYSATTVLATVTGSGVAEIVVTGKPYIESTVLVSSSIAELPAGEIAQIASVSDNKLIVGNAKAVTAHILGYLSRRIKQKFSFWSDPSLQAGDCVEVETMFGQSSKGVIEKQEISFSPALKGSMEVTG